MIFYLAKGLANFAVCWTSVIRFKLLQFGLGSELHVSKFQDFIV
jgi:hypothetical protein